MQCWEFLVMEGEGLSLGDLEAREDREQGVALSLPPRPLLQATIVWLK